MCKNHELYSSSPADNPEKSSCVVVELGGSGGGSPPASAAGMPSGGAIPKPFPLVVTFEYLDDCCTGGGDGGGGDNNLRTNHFEVESADATSVYSYLELWHMEMLSCDDDTLVANFQQLIAFENDDLGRSILLEIQSSFILAIHRTHSAPADF